MVLFDQKVWDKMEKEIPKVRGRAAPAAAVLWASRPLCSPPPPRAAPRR